jgi:8-oxo-dGTP pyrophosphatase MutT (NUDIX family)
MPDSAPTPLPAANAPLEKVTVFITRDPAHVPELLVFRHPHAGVQIPAGTVEEGEPAETAALREAWEETGLNALTVVNYLGAVQTTLKPDARVALRRAVLLQQPAPDAPETDSPLWFLGLRRGLFVRLLREDDNGWAQVAFEEFDGPAHLAATPARSHTGWLPADAITATVVRHFFHLTPTEPTLDTWVQSAEEWEHRFELFWTPLTHPMEVEHLVPMQAAWLHDYAAKLRNP